GSLKQDVTVEPDPHFTISDADRKKRHDAIRSAYSLQQQLAAARETALSLAEQMKGLRQYFSAVDNKAAIEAIDKVNPQIAQAQGKIDAAITAAAQVENAMDGYDGLPTVAQIRQIDWAWEDSAAAVEALN